MSSFRLYRKGVPLAPFGTLKEHARKRRIPGEVDKTRHGQIPGLRYSYIPFWQPGTHVSNITARTAHTTLLSTKYRAYYMQGLCRLESLALLLRARKCLHARSVCAFAGALGSQLRRSKFVISAAQQAYANLVYIYNYTWWMTLSDL